MYKSSFEDKIAENLESRGAPFEYEQRKLKYTVPARVATYTPDFELQSGVIVEAKGWLTPEDRQKMLLVRRDNPDLDIRFLFQGDPAKRPIYKGSKTTYAKWCEDNDFLYAWKTIPDDWLKEPTT